MPRYDLAIFDFDGTLADSFHWFVGALNQAAQVHGFRGMAEGEVEGLRGADNRQLIAHFGLPMWKLPLVARDMRRLQAERIGDIRLFEGVATALDSLRHGGMRLAVVTSNSRANVDRVLGPLGQQISHFGCGAALFGKPAKIRKVLAATGTPPQRAILIGDEIRDIEAARKTGLAAGAVAWGYASPAALQAHGPDALFTTLPKMTEHVLGD